MRCAAQLRPTVAWRRISPNALSTLPKSHSSSGVLSRFQDQMHPCLHVLRYMKVELNLLANVLTACSVTLQHKTRPGQEASISYGVFLDTAPGPSKLHFYIFFGRQPDQRSSDHRSCARTGKYDRPCCRCNPPSSKNFTVRAVVHLQAERDASFVQNAGLQLIYAVNTHCHADHITGTGALKKLFPSVKSVISQDSKCTSDMHVVPGDKVQVHVERLLNRLCECCMRLVTIWCFQTACGLSLMSPLLMQLIFGESSLEVLATPGHTSGCVTYYSPQDDGVAFTGDALLIQGCGRTDFQEGNARYQVI